MAEKEKSSAEDRMTDGGIFIIGDDIIYDSEGKKYGPRKQPEKPKAVWPDVDE